MKSKHNIMAQIASATVVLGLFAACSSCLHAANESPSRPNLTGTVQDDNGRPLGQATVFIYTAGPRQGAGILCPSCYADCRKRATTDADGRFLIESLDPSLLFRVLVVAQGRQPEFVSKVDPAEQPLAVVLKPESGGATPQERLQGRVVDSDDHPVSGAVISIRGVTRGSSTRFGGNTNIDPVAVSDASGRFVINATEPFDAAGLEVEARGLARGIFQRLATGETNHVLKLTEGVAVKGRLLKDGAALAGIEVGIAGADRSSDIFVGDFTVATDDRGQFLFTSLPPRTDYYLYGLMHSLGDKGSVPAQRLRTPDDGSTIDIGDVPIQTGYTVAGRVRLADGQPLATNVPVLLGREDAWDTQQVRTDARGRFRFVGVPPEIVSLSTRIKGYRLSLHNASLDLLNPFHLVGRIASNKSDLVLELEPGQNHGRLNGDSTAIREEPLRGAEARKNQTGDIQVRGKVVDAKSQQPLPFFTVTEGRQSPYRETIDWLSTRKTDQSNGLFTVFFMAQRLAPAVLVEAEGYIPQSSGLIDTNGTNITFALEKGSGPAGVVLLPDGRPATNTTVYLADMRNGVYVGDERLTVRESVYRGTRRTLTDSQGRFSFAPQIDAYAILILDQAGYAEVPVAELKTHSEIHLQPYARIEGELRIGSRPGTNESVRLGLAFVPYDSYPRSFPPLSFYLTTRTDKRGRFLFERIPPIAVEVYHEPKVRDSRMGTIAQSQTEKIFLEPGEIRHLVLGGQGRPVLGRLAVHGYEGTIDYRADVQTLESIVPQPPELPDLLAMSREFSTAFRTLTTDEEKVKARAEFQRGREEAIEKTRAFYATAAGRRYYFAKRRFALDFAQDGSFRIEDVPGGKYSLKIELREGSGDSPSRYSAPLIARLTKEIEVPGSPGGRSDEPFDLGTLDVEARTVLRAGKPAPDFAVKTIDDRPLKLADFKGKYLLLDFWAVWCGPCVAETPHLKAAWEAFKDDPRFAMVGLSLDPDVATPRDYTKKHGIGWTQGFLGEWSKSDVPARFGVEGIPSIFLIGPDGKIVAKGLRGAKIKATVEEALEKN